ncbi:MAG: NB-ARC domain-containing protein, partial [Cyanobacteria bacterium P01_B01_bin.77]
MAKHYSYGDTWKKRVIHLLEVLLKYANDELEDYELKGLSITWQDKDTSAPKLIIRTKLRILASLSQQVYPEDALKTAQIRDALNHYLKIFLGVLQDHREKPKGSENWHFSLTLWSKETSYNLQRINQLWGIKRGNNIQAPQTKSSKSNHISPTRTLKPGAPFQAPPLPRHYVQRPSHFDAVKALLLNESTPGTLVISAIYGMGGIGKSVLAAALVHDSEIQMRFPDGVLWVTLGQQPDMLSMVNLWIQKLKNDDDYNPTNLQAASLYLRTLLADKQALLVIDDVWHPEHVEPFRIGGTGCCVLVTTRQTKIVGATRYDLELMTPQQSLELLTQCLPHGLSEGEKVKAKTFAREVGYLPLALELAAAQIEYGVTWKELLNAFQSEMVELEVLDLDSDVESISDETIRKRRSLVACFKLSLKLLSPQQIQYFAWLGILPEDVLLTQQMAGTLWSLSPLQAGALLREFRNRALLLSQVRNSGEKPGYRIHDLVHDLAKQLLTNEQYLDLPGLDLTVEQAHRQFLKRYLSHTHDGLWHTVPNDGYIHTHLTWHFENARQPELLHQLLKESTLDGRNGWYEVCESMGQIANFVTDVARAWKAAETLYKQNKSESIVLQYRYALVSTTLNSLEQNIPPELIAVFTKKGFWKPAQGLAHVRQIQKSNQQVESFIALVPHLPPGLMREAVAVVYTIEPDMARANALRVLAPHLSDLEMDEALAVVCTIKDESIRTNTLVEIARHMPELMICKAWTTLDTTIQSESARTSMLRGLAPYMPEYLMSELLTRIHKLESESTRTTVLIDIARHIPKSFMSQVLSIISTTRDESAQVKALRGLAKYLPQESFSEVLTIISTTRDESAQVEVLREVAKYLPQKLFNKVLSIVNLIKSEPNQVEILRGLAEYTPQELHNEVLSIVSMIKSESNQAAVLREIVPHIPESIGIAIEVVRKLKSESAQ